MVANTESMDDLEKEYWTTLLPSMTKEQKDRLAGIIETHDMKVKELESKYGKVRTDEEKVKMREEWIEYLTKD